MSLISVENLTFAYPGSYDNIFVNVSFSLDTNWKLGFVGRNGRGKTTFLNLLMGKYEYSGKIHAGVRFSYFPYKIEDKTQLTKYVLDLVCPDVPDWQLMRELNLLQVKEDVLWRPFDTLSGGEQTKVLLAALFLNEGSFLLIDEPTNHLDTAARQCVAEYLKKKSGFILVSHDRAFLDGCVDHILSINRTDIEVRSGNFSNWFEDFGRRQQAELEENERLKKDISRLKQAARRTSDWSKKSETAKYGEGHYDRGFAGHKAEKIMKRSKAIEARQLAAIEKKESLLKNRETAKDLKLSPLWYHSDLLVQVKDAVVCYDGRRVNAPCSFEVRRGDRIVLQGTNGCGKSSLLAAVMGRDIPISGLVKTASGLVISHVSQNTEDLKGDLTDYARESGIDESLFKAILRQMDFERTQFEKDISSFSGGQKKKVLIARSLCQQAHLYIWDEPLNFIDLYSRLQIQNLILQFCPTMLMVEHDIAFAGEVGTKFVEISPLS